MAAKRDTTEKASFEDADPRSALISKYYFDLLKAKNQRDVDYEVYQQAYGIFDEMIKYRKSELTEALKSSADNANSSSHASASSMAVVAAVGIGLVANSITDFSQRNAALMMGGVLLLVVSLIFGWIQIHKDKMFHENWAVHYLWSLREFHHLRWTDETDLFKKIEQHRKESNLENQTKNYGEYAQIGFLVAGYVLLILGLADLLNTPSYLQGLL